MLQFYNNAGEIVGQADAIAGPMSGASDRVGPPSTVPEDAVNFRIALEALPGASFTGLGRIGSIFVNEMSSGELIVDGSVTADKITAGAVTAAKINVTELSAISGNMGIITAGLIRSGTTGQRTEIDVNGGRSYHPNGQLAVRWGVWT